MSITDELRHNIEGAEQLYGCECKHLLAIADRIDAEHEAMLVDARKTVYQGYIELPKDADNVPWNVGDRDEDGNEVIALKLASDGWYVIAVGEWPYRPESKRHYHAPTVEGVLREFADLVQKEHVELATISDDAITEYASKLQLREDA